MCHFKKLLGLVSSSIVKICYKNVRNLRTITLRVSSNELVTIPLLVNIFVTRAIEARPIYGLASRLLVSRKVGIILVNFVILRTESKNHNCKLFYHSISI